MEPSSSALSISFTVKRPLLVNPTPSLVAGGASATADGVADISNTVVAHQPADNYPFHCLSILTPTVQKDYQCLLFLSPLTDAPMIHPIALLRHHSLFYDQREDRPSSSHAYVAAAQRTIMR
eukprot:m.453919 g.453919  ORF g.453919 m.453919 type:complete len:122 (+) comp20574_c0_seq1:4059-4424(+)